jgi:hypothetical protein
VNSHTAQPCTNRGTIMLIMDIGVQSLKRSVRQFQGCTDETY